MNMYNETVFRAGSIVSLDDQILYVGYLCSELQKVYYYNIVSYVNSQYIFSTPKSEYQDFNMIFKSVIVGFQYSVQEYSRSRIGRYNWRHLIAI